MLLCLVLRNVVFGKQVLITASRICCNGGAGTLRNQLTLNAREFGAQTRDFFLQGFALVGLQDVSLIDFL